ncbi:MAG: hypothetical protein KJO69_03350 [Gammaproteobacteria bacterium]|nr:hypothetical protein [Gammaproteobacteria bacterium]
MTEPVTITPESFAFASVQYYKGDYPETLRYGQFLCNRYNITDSELFNETDYKKIVQHMTDKYVVSE